MVDYVMSVRDVENGSFVAEVGPTHFLIVPDGQPPAPSHTVDAAIWYEGVITEAAWENNKGDARGDILFIVHGYNMSSAEVIDRHRRIKADLNDLKFQGVIVSFDWPSDDKALAYLPDRHRAKITAMQLVTDGIAQLSARQSPECNTNIHVLGHSTGAYVIREAFDDADDTGLKNPAWNVSQLIMAAGDVSAGSMSDGNPESESIYGHCVRLTNYSSRHDEALDLSNVKRVGTAPRVGRIGLPSGAPNKAVNVDCTDYYERLTKAGSDIADDQRDHQFVGMQSHSWYFGNRMFAKDLFAVMIGLDRTVSYTRDPIANNAFSLKHTLK